ncbi:MAG TPA: tRNA pseudouridine(38-40) synthase TruA [Aquificales bacterium]|nr:tRNA pseudouridine(38-40) synthase TruA [Aquificales bacterium]
MGVSYYNYLLELSFLGTGFHGWQYQPNVRTIQGELLKAIGKLFKVDWVPLVGCSRTDAGVHAEQFFANFKVDKFIEPYKVLKALNGTLPPEIAVKSVSLVPLSFNSRFSAKGKIYRYLIWNSKIRNPFLLDRAWHIPLELNFSAMEEAAKIFLGTHDFTSFSKNDDGRNPVITVEFLQLKREGDLIEIRIRASHFLRYMVRRMVATLVEVGKGGLKVEEVRHILEKKNPRLAPFNAKPYGLYLHKVFL